MTAIDVSVTPAADLVGFYEPGSAAWLAERADALGGSEIAAVVGLSPWESKFSLWHRKAGLVGPVEETEQMAIGKVLEDPICDRLFAERHPEFEVVRCGLYRHRERLWQVAQPDRFAVHRETGEVVLVEAKNLYDGDGWGEPGTDQVPVYYRAQVQWQLDTIGVQRVILPVLVAGCEYREYEIAYDPADAGVLREAGEQFIASVRACERPDIDSSSATYQVIRELHPDIDDVKVTVPFEVADGYRTACQAAKDATDAKQLATNVLADAMGRARRAIDPLGEQVAIRVSNGDGTPFVRPSNARGQKK